MSGKPVSNIVPIIPLTERDFGRATENLIIRAEVEEHKRVKKAEEERKKYIDSQCKQLVLEDLTEYAKKRIYGLGRDGYLYQLARFLEVFFSEAASKYPGLIPTKPKAILIKGHKNIGKTSFIKKFFQMNTPSESFETDFPNPTEKTAKNLGQTASRNLYWLKWSRFTAPDGKWSENKLKDFFACIDTLISKRLYSVVVIDDLDKHIDDPNFMPFVNKFLKMYQDYVMKDAKDKTITLLASIRPENVQFLEDTKLFPEQYQFEVDYPDVSSLTDYYFEQIRDRLDKSLRRLITEYLFQKGRLGERNDTQWQTLEAIFKGIGELTGNEETTFLDAIEEGIPSYDSVRALVQKKKTKNPSLTFTDIAAIIEKQSYENILDFFNTETFQKVTTSLNGKPTKIPVTLFGNIIDVSNLVLPRKEVIFSEIWPPSLDKIHDSRSKDAYGSDQIVGIKLKNGILQQKYRAMKRVFSKNKALIRIMFGSEQKSYEKANDNYKSMYSFSAFLNSVIFGETEVQALWKKELVAKKPLWKHMNEVKLKNDSVLLKQLRDVLIDQEYDMVISLINSTFDEFMLRPNVIDQLIYERLRDEKLYIALVELAVLKISFILEGIFITHVLRFDFDTNPDPTLLLSVWDNSAFSNMIASRLLSIVDKLSNDFAQQKTYISNATEVEETKSYKDLFVDLFGVEFFETNPAKYTEDIAKQAYNGLAESVTKAHLKLDDCLGFFAHLAALNVAQFGSYQSLLTQYPTTKEITNNDPKQLLALATRKIIRDYPYPERDPNETDVIFDEKKNEVNQQRVIAQNDEKARLKRLPMIELQKEIETLVLTGTDSEDMEFRDKYMVKSFQPMMKHQYFLITCCRHSDVFGYNYNESNLQSRPLSQIQYRYLLGTFQDMNYGEWNEFKEETIRNQEKFNRSKDTKRNLSLANFKLLESKSKVFRKITQRNGLFDFWFPLSVVRNEPPKGDKTFHIQDKLKAESSTDADLAPFIINVNYQLPKDTTTIGTNFQTSLLLE